MSVRTPLSQASLISVCEPQSIVAHDPQSAAHHTPGPNCVAQLHRTLQDTSLPSVHHGRRGPRPAKPALYNKPPAATTEMGYEIAPGRAAPSSVASSPTDAHSTPSTLQLQSKLRARGSYETSSPCSIHSFLVEFVLDKRMIWHKRTEPIGCVERQACGTHPLMPE